MRENRKRDYASGEAGISVLEMLIALAICALVVVVLSATVIPKAPAATASYVQILSFIDERRTAALLSGNVVAIDIEADRLVSGAQSVVWSTETVRVSIAGSLSSPVGRLLLFPDGTTLGPAVAVHDSAGDHFVRLVGRPA